MDIKVLASSSGGNCYLVDDGITKILIDAGIPWKEIQRRLDYKTHEVSSALISHSHMDHCKSVKDAVKAGVDCYMSQETADAIGVSGHRIKPVKALEQFRIGTWVILPFPTEHDVEGSLGFLLASDNGSKTLYLTDTAYSRYRFNELSHIMIECNYSLDILRENVANGTVPVELKNRLLKTHFSLENAKGFLRANDLSKVQEIHLLHLSDGNSDAARFKREIQQLTGKPVCVAGE